MLIFINNILGRYTTVFQTHTNIDVYMYFQEKSTDILDNFCKKKFPIVAVSYKGEKFD
jgi:hypothetical protein